MRHKSGGKWAKEMQKRGVRNDQTRDAQNEKNRISEELRRKIAGVGSGSEEDERDQDSDDSEDMEARFDEVAETEAPAEPTKGLMALKFMKAGAEKDKKQATEMVERMRQQETEFEDLWGQSDEEEEEENGKAGDQKKKKKEKASKKEEAQTSGRRVFGPKTGKGETESYAEEDGEREPYAEEDGYDDEDNPWLASEESVVLKVKSTKKQNLKKDEVQASKIKVQARAVSRQQGGSDGDDQEVISLKTPTMTAIPRDKKQSAKEAQKKRDTPSAHKKSRKGDDDDDDGEDLEETTGFTIDDEDDSGQYAIQQRELIQRAFAHDDVVQQDFLDEKDALVDAETNKDKDVTLPGWVRPPTFSFSLSC